MVSAVAQGGVSIVLLLSLALVAIFIVFWVKMLVDAITREFKDSGTKTVWVLVILLWHGMGALIYYYAVYAKDSAARPAPIQAEQNDG